MIRIEWRTFTWHPANPPDREEYNFLRLLDEAAMKNHLKEVLLPRVRAQMEVKSPYTYRASLIMLAVSVVMLSLSVAFDPGGDSKPAHWYLLRYGGWLAVFIAFLNGASASMTYDSIRKNLIVAREHYVRCWTAAKKLDYDQFEPFILRILERGPPECDRL